MITKVDVVAECHGVKVPDSPMMNPTRAARINEARYEGQEIAGALKVIRPGDHVLEMGAGIGLVGAIATKNGRPAKVLSFEANPNLIPHINALYKLNGVEDTIEVRNEILMSANDAPASMPFHLQNSYLGSSLIQNDKHLTEIQVPTTAYSKIHSQFAPTVLLMDIEGGELEFLRHASLEGIRAIVIEFHPKAYDKAGMRECKNIIRKAGFVKIPELSTRQVWTCVIPELAEPPQPETGWATEINTLENAVIVPSAEQGFVQKAGVLHSDGSYHAASALWRNGRELTIAPDQPEEKPVQRTGTWLWGGVLWMHFGHFLVESTSRLWALDGLDQDIDGILFIPKRPRNGSDVAGFQRDFVALMGTGIPVEAIDKTTQVERLIVPGQGFGLGKMIAGTDQFRAAISKNFATDIKPEGSKKLYISRSQLPADRGTLIGEDRLERYLEAEGYTIYHPQKHDIKSQIATYKAATHIIAAEGSALHLLAMVAKPKQQVAIVVRRLSGATRNLEIHLQAFADVTPVTLTKLTRSWKPLGNAKPRHWMGELDMPALQSDLADAGFIKADKTKWIPLDASEVKSWLGDKFEEVV